MAKVLGRYSSYLLKNDEKQSFFKEHIGLPTLIIDISLIHFNFFFGNVFVAHCSYACLLSITNFCTQNEAQHLGLV
jgi:hypothetical protein